MRQALVRSALSLFAATILVSGSAAFGADKVTPKPSKSPSHESVVYTNYSAYTTALAKWELENKLALNNYYKALAQYTAQEKAISDARDLALETFKKSIDAAKIAFVVASQKATTAEAKTAALNARKAAIASATGARDAALKAIPLLGVKPSKPEMTPKPEFISPSHSPTASSSKNEGKSSKNPKN